MEQSISTETVMQRGLAILSACDPKVIQLLQKDIKKEELLEAANLAVRQIIENSTNDKESMLSLLRRLRGILSQSKNEDNIPKVLHLLDYIIGYNNYGVDKSVAVHNINSDAYLIMRNLGAEDGKVIACVIEASQVYKGKYEM
jgi:hypothetical protein